MTGLLHVPAGEREVVRVFALDMTAPEAEALAEGRASNGGPSGLAALLGAPRLDRDHVEIFPAADLAGVGLPGYLTEGLGVADAEIAADRTALEAESGYIVIVHSPAFGGKAARLSPTPPLRHLGTYRLEQADAPGTLPPAADSSAPARPAPEPARPLRRLPRALVLVVLLAAALLVLGLAWLAGSRG